MNNGDLLKLELKSDPGMLPGVRETMHDWLLPQGWTDDQTAEIVLAVDEALSNVIRHGYNCETSHKILLTAHNVHEAGDDEALEICIRDFGQQCNPAEIRGRELCEVRPGGLGVHIIRAMMSSVEYTPADGGGMLLVMRKYKAHTAGTAQAKKQ